MRQKSLSFLFLLCFFSGLSFASETAVNVEPILEKVPSRPSPELGSTQVSVLMWLVDVDSIDSAQQNFIVNVFMALQWKDPRLAHGGKTTKRFSTVDVWTPRVQIINEIGIVRKTMAEVVDVEGDGTVTYRQRFVGPLSQPLKLHDFPFDRHWFRIHLVSMSGKKGEIDFVPNETGMKRGLKDAVGISPDISLPDWAIKKYQGRPLDYVVTDQIQSPGYAFEFEAARDIRYFVIKVILPLALIVMMSWIAFWIDPKEIGTNISAVMTSMLTLVAYRFTFENYIPKVGYLTRIDKFMLWATLMVFFSMVQVGVNSALVARGHHSLAARIDRFARVVYPVLFMIITLVSFVF